MGTDITHIVLTEKIYDYLFRNKIKKDFFIGTLFPDIRYLEVIKKNDNIVHIIIGTGPEEEKLKKLTKKMGISNYVIFTGFISDEELLSYYSSADLFVLATLYEGFGLVYIDALCFGLPIVTTENGGSLDIINEDNGILVPVKDPVGLGNEINEALNKKWDREKIKAGAEKYRWENIIKEYSPLYDKLFVMNKK